MYTQYGSGIYSVNCKINSKHIAFVQAYSNVYGYVILGGYSRSHLLCSNLNNGTWAHNKILLTSDLADIYTTVTTVANQYVDIPNSPASYSYIPVITYKEDTNLSNDTIVWVDTKWVVFSTVSHTLYVHFYKYPV